jgi:hypothetical protein
MSRGLLLPRVSCSALILLAISCEIGQQWAVGAGRGQGAVCCCFTPRPSSNSCVTVPCCYLQKLCKCVMDLFQQHREAHSSWIRLSSVLVGAASGDTDWTYGMWQCQHHHSWANLQQLSRPCQSSFCAAVSKSAQHSSSGPARQHTRVCARPQAYYCTFTQPHHVRATAHAAAVCPSAAAAAARTALC